MSVNREYKDSVFSWLFSEPGTLRELYGALTGRSIDPSVPITINTLEGVLFKARMNDISFEIGRKLVVLLEHQSTINENMPLRILMYISRIYEGITAKRDIYREKRIPLPFPEFIVLYNGTAPYPDEHILRLSDAFLDPGELRLGGVDFLPLELAAKVYNINEGHNKDMVHKNETLNGYVQFIAKVRECEAALSGGKKPAGQSREDRKAIIETAITQAVQWCIENNILKPFLEKNGSEVINMLFGEWKLEDALVVEREEGREEGREEIARNALGEGLSMEIIQKITGLSTEAIQSLADQ